MLLEIWPLKAVLFFNTTVRQPTDPGPGGTIEMPRRNTPDLIPPTLWPPDSPDLNPVDHKMGGHDARASLSYTNT